MRWLAVALAVAAALLSASGPSLASHTHPIPLRWPDFDPGRDGAIDYVLCVASPAPGEWTLAIEDRWDNALRWSFNVHVGNCSAQTTVKWENAVESCDLLGFPAANACWTVDEDFGIPQPVPHGDHYDLQRTLILVDKPKWDAAQQFPTWRTAMMAHEWGHNMGLTDHWLASQQVAGTLMNTWIENPPTFGSPTPADLSSVLCNVYGRCGDFSGDGCTDVLVREPLVPPPSKDLKIVRGNCGGAFSDQTAVRIGTGWEPFDWLLRPGDFNGNHVNNITGEACTDVIADETDIPHLTRLYPGNCAQGGNYFKGGWTQIGSGWWIYSWALAAGDFDGNKCPDVIFREGDLLKMVRGNCSGGFIDQAAIQIGTGWTTATSILGPGDWNGDGCSDIVGRFGSTLKLYRGNCAIGGQYWKDCCGIVMNGGPSNWSNYTKLAAVGDFTGDGCMDIFSRDSAGTLRVHYGNCSTGFTNGSGTIVGTGWNIFDYIY